MSPLYYALIECLLTGMESIGFIIPAILLFLSSLKLLYMRIKAA